MSSLTQFNKSIHEFVADLKKMKVLPNEIKKLETYIEVTKINARLLIRNFQTFFLRDLFVLKVLQDDVNFFINYVPNEKELQNDKTALQLIQRIQHVVTVMLQNNQMKEITNTFNWLKILVFHAYNDLGIDSTQKFKSLQMNTNINN